jgi:CubicO group peptidase (beta-lactamase class C family)
VNDSKYADGLERAQPREVDVNAAAVEAFLDDAAATGIEIHGLMLHRGGRVVAEGWWWPYRADRPRIMHSVTKSVMASAIGLALDEGRFKLRDKVVSFFPEHLPAVVDDNLAAMTIEDLLTMRAGHAAETSGAIWRGISTSWTAEFFKIPVVHRPGTTYMYTSAASYMLSAILSRVTGQTLHDYLKPRFFAPLGITGEHWDIGPDNINPGGNGLTMKTADLLKLGVVHAQRGLWQGRRILSEAWIDRATRSHGKDNYGYQWATAADGAYLAIGIFMQFVMVFPQYQATLAVIGAQQEGSNAFLPLVQRHFPGAFEEGLPADEAALADERLRARLVAVARPPAIVSYRSTKPAQISGKTYHVEPNTVAVTAVRFDFDEAGCDFHLTAAGTDYRVACGLDWIESRTDVPGRELHHGYSLRSTPVVAGARWLDESTLEMTWIFAQTAFRDTVVCRFDLDRVTIERSVNVNSSALSWPTLTGVLKDSGS